MPELRKDPVVGRWVIIASERARRPGNFVDRNDNEPEDEDGDCLFCNEQRETITRELLPDGVNVVSSRDSVEVGHGNFQRKAHGLYDVIDGFGTHEIVIEASEHIANMADLGPDRIADIIRTYAARMEELKKDTRFQYVLAYKNYGPTAGSRRIGHTRSHIIATPVRPLRVKEKLIGAKQYYDKNGRCVYCDLIKRELEAKERIVQQSEHFIALIPYAARFLFEICIMPLDHHCDFPDGIKGKEEDLGRLMKSILEKFQRDLDDPAYNFVVQTAPFRRSDHGAKWETLERDYHWHIELMPRLTRVAGFEKGTGFYICSIPPEDMAAYLRGA